MVKNKQVEETIIRPAANGVVVSPYSRSGEYIGTDKFLVFNDLEDFTAWAKENFNWRDEQNG